MNKKLWFWLLEQNKKHMKTQAEVFSHGSCTQNGSRDLFIYRKGAIMS